MKLQGWCGYRAAAAACKLPPTEKFNHIEFLPHIINYSDKLPPPDGKQDEFNKLNY